MTSLCSVLESGCDNAVCENLDVTDVTPGRRADLDFDNRFIFLICLDSKFPDFQVPRNLAWARLGPGLGQAWTRLEPSE